MSISAGGTDIMGGGYPTAFAGGGGFGGLVGVGLVGLIGLNNLFGRNGFGDGLGNGAGVVANTVADQNISELRKDVQGVNTTVHALGNEIQVALSQQTLGQTGEFRNLDNRLCESEKATLNMGYALSLQGFQNTQQLTNLVMAFQSATDAKLCNLENAVHADGDATRALINGIEMQNLRDALAAERRRSDQREVEINVTQTNQQTQQVLQNQFQQQSQSISSWLNALGDQVNRAANSVVNVGSGTVAGGQSNNQSATKVNS